MDVQLLYVTGSPDVPGVHVIDLHDHSKFDIDTSLTSIADFTDDGSWLVLDDDTQLTFFQNGKKTGRVPLSSRPSFVVIRPDAKYVAVLHEDKKSELAIIDVATLDVKTIAVRKIQTERIAWTPDGSGVVVFEKRETSDDPAAQGKLDLASLPRDVYNIESGKLVEGSYSEAQLKPTRWNTIVNATISPTECVKADGTSIPFDIDKVVHVSGDKFVTSHGFLPDCESGYFEYGDHLWLFDASGQVVDLVSGWNFLGGHVVPFTGRPFSPQ